MGVNGLWKLIEPVGKPVPLESLENKVLAVDVSIWLYQLTSGLQTSSGGAVPNAHVIGLFNRICKLLYYRIKPIFVFDGGVPVLKKETIETRKEQKRQVKNSSEELREKLLNNLLKQKAVNELLGTNAVPCSSSLEENDIFSLPPLPEKGEDTNESSEDDPDTEVTTAKVESLCDYMYGKDVHSIDITSEQFRSLPPEIRHEILSELIETRKQSSWGFLQEMKKDSNFSDYQMKRLMKRRNVQRSLDQAAKEIGGRMMTLGELEDLFREDGIVTDSLPGRRIAKDSVTQYIYIMGDGKKSDESNDDKKSESMETNQKTIISSTDSVQYPLEEDIEEDKFREQSFQIDQSVFVKDLSLDDEEFIMKQDYVDDYAKQLSQEEKLPQDEILRIIKAQQLAMSESSTSTHCENVVSDEPSTSSLSALSTASKSPSLSSMNKKMNSQTMPAALITQSQECLESHSETDSPDIIEDSQTIFASTTEIGESKSRILESNSPKIVEDAEKPSKILENDGKPVEKVIGQICQQNDAPDLDSPDIIEDSQTVLAIATEIRESRSSNIKSASPKILEDVRKQSPIQGGSEKLFAKPNDDFNFLVNKEESAIRSVNSSNESDSDDDFIEVTCNLDRSSLESVEIIVDPEHRVNTEDIFADIFQDFPAKQGVSTNENLTVQEASKNNGKKKINTLPRKDPEVSYVLNTSEEAENIMAKKETSPQLKKGLSKTDQPVTSEKNEELLNAQRILYEEELELKSKYGKQERMGATITQQMIIETQELLRLFGLPFVIAPMEAEAQCAFLDQASLTEGTITDDSDIWLFGGKNVYKNFFDNRKYVLQFRNLDIEHFFKLSREQLIQMALLVGSDYTVGIYGVGPVTAIEILAYFSDKSNKPKTEADIADALRKFKSWIEKNRNDQSSALSRKMKNVRLSKEFPSMHVIEAYLYPTVDESKESFTWAAPDLDKIRQYMKRKFAWKASRIDDILLPVMKRLNNRQKQTTLDTFFKAKPYSSIDTGNVSERVSRAISIMKNKVDVDFSALPAKSPRKRNKSKTESGSLNTNSTPKKSRQQGKNLLKTFSPSKPHTSNAEEKIPQREKRRAEAAKRKIEAVEVLKKKKKKQMKKKRGVLPPKVDSSYLSESSNEED